MLITFSPPANVPTDHPDLYALFISVRQVLIDHLERGAAIRGECGEVLVHGGSCHVGDDTRYGSRARNLRREAVSCESA